MGFGRLVKWVLFAAILGSAGGFAVMHAQDISGFYRDIYPTDPAKREALDLCFTQDHQFNRLDANERASCYSRAMLPAAAAAGFVPAARPTANPIDLQRAAAVGYMPRNDVRRTEATQDLLHLPH
jgi:hypothetical protein